MPFVFAADHVLVHAVAVIPVAEASQHLDRMVGAEHGDGEVYSPTLLPGYLNARAEARIWATEPLPLVPAMCMVRSDLWGFPRNRAKSVILSRPG